VSAGSEERRLRALQAYRILDTEAEFVYDMLAELAASRCAAPVAVLAFLDADRADVKATFGIARPPAVARAVAFAERVIRSEDVLEIADLDAEPELAANPLVREHRFRFYAGVALVTPERERIGVLSVFDVRPRSLTAEQRAQLPRIAQLAVGELERRKQLLRRVDEDEQERHRVEVLEARHAEAELVARLARELRGPVTSIVGFARLLEEDDRFPLEAREALALMRASGQHIGGLADDIELLGKIERRAAEPQWTALDVAALLRRIAIPVESRGPARVVGDALLLELALTRLNERAREAGMRLYARTEPGTTGLAIVFSGDPRALTIPIPAGSLAVHLARRVAQRHAGGLGVAEAGWLRMTLADDPREAPGQRTVLVVDENPAELAGRLVRLGFTVLTARSAGDAAAQLDAADVAVVPLGRAPQGIGATLAAAGDRIGLVALVGPGEEAGDRWDVSLRAPALPAELRSAVHTAATKARVRGGL